MARCGPLPAPAAAAALLLLVAAVVAPRCVGAAAGTEQADSETPPGSDDTYLVGIGKADVTGPIADVNPMGYSMPDQIAKGLHTRLYARTFIFAEPQRPERRVVFVNLDAAMASQIVTMKVLEALQEEFGCLYNRHNVVISGTHTHASPGGFLQYLAYSLSSLGFVEQTFEAMRDGILESIRQAHGDLRPSQLTLAQGELLEATINRSPTAYEANPASERAQYAHDTDKTMTMLRVTEAAPSEAPRGRGLLNWFAVHPVSMNNSNSFISGDNKGAAELFTEQWAAKQPGLGPGFVAAFAQGAVGDTTPNTLGAFCYGSDVPCDREKSTCGKTNALCWGRGPGWPDDIKATEINGRLQFDKAKELWQAKGRPITGPIESRHTWVDMSNVEVKRSQWTEPGRTCSPAMGFSFAAGTTDGPGSFFFTQSDRSGSPLWRLVRNALSRPSPELEACHAPKPILLNAGEMNVPHPWLPRVVDVSLLRIGSLAVAAVPGEFTTMASRRLTRAVSEAVGGAWGPGLTVVLAGLSGTYSSYVTTPEEYGVQRYEGGFTLYGPKTLEAYVQTMVGLAEEMASGAAPPPPVATPPDLLPRQFSLLAPPGPDGVPPGAAFGEAVVDAAGAYRRGEVVEVSFRAANPRNDLRRGGTFLLVQRLDRSNGGGWVNVSTDAGWDTKFSWERHWAVPTQSFATVKWTIPEDTPAGIYRIRTFGNRKTLTGAVKPFEGTSGSFVVAGSEAEYEAAAARFAALSKALGWSNLPGLVKGAAGGLEVTLTGLAGQRAREPLVIAPGVGLPQALSPPRASGRWWRAGAPGAHGGPPGLAAAAAAGSVHRRCPEWWAERVACSLGGKNFTFAS